ncbi:alpha/beta fold hydrolase [Allofournierella sp.]|uniref:alpha/beta fold hydrolase n=1 Tax=Allofournierella sp. TaxID=1940256 RepID=UPI003AB8936C
MPQIDWPLEQLKTYRGKSPRPADWQAYWARALGELETADLSYTYEKDPIRVPGVECGHLWFRGVGGARVHAQLMRPTGFLGPRPAMLLFHGYEGHSHDWYEKLPFAQSGIAVAALDVRGQAGLSQDTLQIGGSTFRGHIVRGVDEEDPDKLFFRSVYLDTVQLARIVAGLEFVDERRLASVGFSQGGALAIACAALSGQMERTVAGYPFLSDFRRVRELDYPNPAYDELKLYFRLRDPRHEKETRFFERLGYLDVQWMAEKLTAPVLFYTGLADMICPPSCQFAVYNRITAPKRQVIYPDYGHELLPGAWQEILLWLLAEGAPGQTL